MVYGDCKRLARAMPSSTPGTTACRRTASTSVAVSNWSISTENGSKPLPPLARREHGRFHRSEEHERHGSDQPEIHGRYAHVWPGAGWALRAAIGSAQWRAA